MTCLKLGNSGIICYSKPSFTFRFLIWKCEFTDSMCAGPYWYISVPYFSFSDFKTFAIDWRDPLDWKAYTGMTEIYFEPGEKSPLWKIFDYHHRKWMKSKEREVTC